MLDFSLNSVSAVSNSRSRLEPYKIHNVKFEEAKIEEFDGKKDPNQHYKVLRVRFGNEEGYYDESIFLNLRDEDGVMREFDNADGTKRYYASRFDQIKYFMAQTMTVLNPEGMKKFQEAATKFRSIDDMVKAYIIVMDQVKGAETQLKLMGRTNQNGNVEACLPRFLSVNKNKEVFVSSNFVGPKLFFSTYEEGQVNAAKAAKPTAMPEFDVKDPGTYNKEEKKEEEIDLSDLL